MYFLIATKNPGKFSEITAGLGRSFHAGVESINFLSPRDLGIDDTVEEIGATHEENAIGKAQYFFEKTGLPTLGEDSGIYVDAFPGELGVRTRRWGNLYDASDKKWIRYFLKKMESVPEGKRGAKFVCFAAVILGETKVLPSYAQVRLRQVQARHSRPLPSVSLGLGPTRSKSRSSIYVFSGETRGTITKTLEAPLKPGIPISSCFRPDGCDKVYAALTSEAKNRVSHRGQVMQRVKAFLEDTLRDKMC